MSNAVDFIVERQNLRHTKFIPAPDPESVDVPAEHALLRVDAFASRPTTSRTRSPATYVVLELLPREPGWGRVPVWGLPTSCARTTRACRSANACSGTYRCRRTSWFGRTASRAPASSTRRRTASRSRRSTTSTHASPTTPGYRKDQEDRQMLFRPLL